MVNILSKKISLAGYTISFILIAMLGFGLALGDPLTLSMIVHNAIALLMLSLLLFALLQTPLAKNNCDNVITTIIWAALIYYLVYLAFSGAPTKQTDFTGHKEYIKFLYSGYFPNPIEGWQTYQPPLYHLLATPFYAMGKLLDIPEPFDFVRYLSVALSLVFFLYFVSLLKLFIRNKYIIYSALILLAVWPIGVNYAGKINNDILLFAIILPSLFYLTRWFQANDKNDLWYSVIIASLAIAAKSTGLIMCGVIFLIVLYRLIRKEISFRSILPSAKLLLIVLVIALSSASLNFGRTILYAMEESSGRNILIGNSTDRDPEFWGASYIYDDNWTNYSGLDIKQYFTNDFVNIFDKDDSERLVFFNAYLKTSVTGDGLWAYPNLAKMLYIGYLLMFIYIGFCALLHLAKGRGVNASLLPAALLYLSSIGALMFMRINLPITSLGDARFIHYLVPITIIWCAYSADTHLKHGNKNIGKLGIALLVLMSILSITFMFSQYFDYWQNYRISV